MLKFLAAVATCLGTGLASAVFPLVNAELATVVAAGLADPVTAWACVAAIAVGQTIGKIVIYEAARAGRTLHQRRSRSGRPAPPAAPTASPPPATGPEPPTPLPTAGPTWWGRCRAWLGRVSRRLEAAMDTRWHRVVVMLLSSSLGVPPLLAMAALAGAIRMPRFDYIACVLAGRLLRFGVIAWPVLVLTG